MLALRNVSLRRKLTLIMMLTSTVALLLACAGFVAFDMLMFRREMVESLSTLAEVVGNNTTAAIDFDKPLEAEETLGALRGEPNIVLAHVHTVTGQIFATYVREGKAFHSTIHDSLAERHAFTASHLHLFHDIKQGGEKVGTIELVADLTELRDRLWRYAGIAGVVLAASLLVAFGLSNRLQQLVSTPIQHLARLARLVAQEKNYALRATKYGEDELGQLVDGFNEMLAQIQQRDNSLQSVREGLEARVVERTAELASINQSLQARIADRHRAEAALLKSERFLRSTLDALSSHIAILDCQGVIVQVNTAWNRFAGENHFAGLHRGVGEDYLQICDSASGPGSAEASTVADGIRAVMAGEIDAFDLEYPCHSPAEQRWFMVRVTRFGGDGEVRVVVAHENITQRKQAEAETEAMHSELLNVSRQAGMAEVATSVLHNVGNVLNSVNISAGLIVEHAKRSRATSLAQVVALLQEQASNLGTFMTQDARGQHVLPHLAQLSKHLVADQAAIVAEMDSLRRNVEHIKEIVATQQSYARFGGVKEMVDVVQLAEDSLRMSQNAAGGNRVEVVREFLPVPRLNLEKHKLLQILVNLVHNAHHACQDSDRADQRVTMRVADDDGRVRISVTDNGVGISPENLIRIFSHGFTTRKGGHGFGLHSGALAAKELGGSLIAQSAGPGQGAVFTLELPGPTQENSHDNPSSHFITHDVQP